MVMTCDLFRLNGEKNHRPGRLEETEDKKGERKGKRNGVCQRSSRAEAAQK